MPGFVTAMVIVIHVVVCMALMASILLQSGKGGGLAGAFGAGSSQTLFGGRGAATFLSRATAVLAVVFFLTSLTLGLQASRSGRGAQSLIQEEARKRSQQRAATEGAGAPTAPVPGAVSTPAPVNQPPAAANRPPAASPTGGSNAPPAAGENTSPATGTTK